MKRTTTTTAGYESWRNHILRLQHGNFLSFFSDSKLRKSQENLHTKTTCLHSLLNDTQYAHDTLVEYALHFFPCSLFRHLNEYVWEPALSLDIIDSFIYKCDLCSGIFPPLLFILWWCIIERCYTLRVIRGISDSGPHHLPNATADDDDVVVFLLPRHILLPHNISI